MLATGSSGRSAVDDLSVAVPTFQSRPNEGADCPEKSPERDALRAAQATLAAALAAARTCAAAAARGRADLARAQAAVALHDGLDGRIAVFNAERVRAGVPADRAALPADLVEQRRARALAFEDLRDVEAVVALLDADAGAADAAALAAAAACKAAADLVAENDAVALAARVRVLDSEAGTARAVVMTYLGTRTIADGPAPWAVEGLRHDDHAGYLLAIAKPDLDGLRRRWLAYRKALLQDPDAVLPEAG